jgi:hypothetical protein
MVCSLTESDVRLFSGNLISPDIFMITLVMETSLPAIRHRRQNLAKKCLLARSECFGTFHALCEIRRLASVARLTEPMTGERHEKAHFDSRTHDTVLRQYRFGWA